MITTDVDLKDIVTKISKLKQGFEEKEKLSGG
jgi:hypothetical protein